MIPYLRKLFSPPTFHDEEKNHLAQLLNTILWAVTITASSHVVLHYIVIRDLLTVSTFAEVNFLPKIGEVGNAAIAVVSLCSLKLMGYGQVKLAAQIFVLFLWVNITIQAMLVGGVHDAAYNAYFTISVLAALLVGPWFGVIVTLLAIVSGYFLAYAEVNQMFAIHAEEPYSVWLDNSILLALMAVFVFLSTKKLIFNLNKTRQSTQQIALAYQELQKANQVKSQFITMMSHELRTPLNAVNNFAELMVSGISGELPEAAQKDAQLIYQNGKHLTTLLEDILDIVQIEMKDIKLSLQTVIVEDILKMVSAEIKPHADKKSLDFDYTIAPNAEFVQADPTRLKQILLNLVQNAVKFTAQGQVSIQVQLYDQDMVCFAISDTGIGIPKSEQARLFEAFQQLDMSDSREYGGTGLGLSICRELVHLHHGEIWLESEVGQGTTVHFTMAAAKLEMGEPV